MVALDNCTVASWTHFADDAVSIPEVSEIRSRQPQSRQPQPALATAFLVSFSLATKCWPIFAKVPRAGFPGL